jgi:hypothetical protein
MGDGEPNTKVDFHNLMTRIEAMMVVLENQKTQLDALTSGTTSAAPPALVDSLKARRFHLLQAMSPGDTSKCHTLPLAVLCHHLILLALPIGKITCALT